MGKYKPIDDLYKLQRGTIIKHVLDQRPFVVTANYGDRVTAVATVDVTNMSEWQWFDETATKDGEQK